MTVEELIRKYIGSKKVMQLATERDGQPWLSTVHYYVDDDLNLYWISTESRRHSQEIKDNPRAAAAIAIQTDEEIPGNVPIGIQVEGNAELIKDPEIIKKYLRKYFDYTQKPETIYEDIISGANPHRLYRLKPSLFVLFDVQNFPDDPRQEWRVGSK